MAQIVQVLKFENAAGGGSAADDIPYPASINKFEDSLEAAGIFFQRGTVQDTALEITRDISNNMTFKDGVNTTPVTLTQLLTAQANLISAQFVLASDITITSTAYNNVLAGTYNKQSNSSKLLIMASMGIGTTAGQHGSVQLFVNSTTYGATGVYTANLNYSVSAAFSVIISDLSAGNISVVIRGKMANSSRSLYCRHITKPDYEFCRISVIEF